MLFRLLLLLVFWAASAAFLAQCLTRLLVEEREGSDAAARRYFEFVYSPRRRPGGPRSSLGVYRFSDIPLRTAGGRWVGILLPGGRSYLGLYRDEEGGEVSFLAMGERYFLSCAMDAQWVCPLGKALHVGEDVRPFRSFRKGELEGRTKEDYCLFALWSKQYFAAGVFCAVGETHAPATEAAAAAAAESPLEEVSLLAAREARWMHRVALLLWLAVPDNLGGVLSASTLTRWTTPKVDWERVSENLDRNRRRRRKGWEENEEMDTEIPPLVD